MNTTFKEEQKFTQWWLWLILIGVGVLPLIAIYQQLVAGESFGDNPMSDAGLIVYAVVTYALLAMFATVRLKTELDDSGIRVRFVPFTKKKVSWDEVKSAEVLDYGFVGGWGIRLWTSYGTVYNTKGSMGLAVQLKNGKKFLIGTQKETELKHFIDRMERSNLG